MALPLDIFANETEGVILQIKAKALQFFQEGKTIINYGVAGRTVGKQMVASPEEVIAACNYALKLKDPATYGEPPVDRYVVRF